jgi:dephospho-CoA kinase
MGAGKSRVGNLFRQAKIPCYDADQLGHACLAADTPQTQAIKNRFPEIVQGESIVRSRLATLAFSSKEIRRWLEELLHPAILQMFRTELEHLTRPGAPFCILEGAVLIESQVDFSLAGLIVVTAPTSIRIQRIQQRDGLDQNEIQGRIRSQYPEHEKVQRASHLIDNSGCLACTEKQVAALMTQLAAETGC